MLLNSIVRYNMNYNMLFSLNPYERTIACYFVQNNLLSQLNWIYNWYVEIFLFKYLLDVSIGPGSSAPLSERRDIALKLIAENKIHHEFIRTSFTKGEKDRLYNA